MVRVSIGFAAGVKAIDHCQRLVMARDGISLSQCQGRSVVSLRLH